MIVETEMNINPVAWQAWKNDPVTQEVFRAIQAERDVLAQELIEGVTLERPGQEVVQTARHTGMIYGFDGLLVGVEEALQVQWEEARLKSFGENQREEE